MVIDKLFYRPAEIHLLQGDFTNSKEKLNWEPTVKFDELVKMMVEADLEHGRLLLNQK